MAEQQTPAALAQDRTSRAMVLVALFVAVSHGSLALWKGQAELYAVTPADVPLVVDWMTGGGALLGHWLPLVTGLVVGLCAGLWRGPLFGAVAGAVCLAGGQGILPFGSPWSVPLVSVFGGGLALLLPSMESPGWAKMWWGVLGSAVVMAGLQAQLLPAMPLQWIGLVLVGLGALGLVRNLSTVLMAASLPLASVSLGALLLGLGQPGVGPLHPLALGNVAQLITAEAPVLLGFPLGVGWFGILLLGAVLAGLEGREGWGAVGFGLFLAAGIMALTGVNAPGLLLVPWALLCGAMGQQRLLFGAVLGGFALVAQYALSRQFTDNLTEVVGQETVVLGQVDRLARETRGWGLCREEIDSASGSEPMTSILQGVWSTAELPSCGAPRCVEVGPSASRAPGAVQLRTEVGQWAVSLGACER